MATYPKVVFYGGMANNCYVVAKQMRLCGMEAFLLRDDLDNYAISQPVWEDARFSLSYQELGATSTWSASMWRQKEQSLGWTPPEWVLDVDSLTREADPDFSKVRSVSLANYTPAPAPGYRKIIAFFQECDLIFVSNVHAIILALLANKPFVICPAGGEFMIAAGQIKATGAVARVYRQQAKLLRAAFASTSGILTNTSYFHHTALTGGFVNLLRWFPRSNFRQISLPYSVDQLKTSVDKSIQINELLSLFNLPAITSKYTIFIPSRIDFQWKGQDLLMQAIDACAESREFTFVFSGWGADYLHMREWSEGRENIRMLPAALSKPLLLDFYRASDLVIDQFKLGHIGTAAREAVAVGCPVMANIKSSFFLGSQPRPELPVLQASTTDDIAAWLRGIVDGSCSLNAFRIAGIEWIEKYSNPSSMMRALQSASLNQL